MTTKTIYTSYYGRCGGHDDAVSISVSAPKFFEGPVRDDLAPTWDMVHGFKDGSIDELEYTKRYLALLRERGLDPQEVYESIPDNTILLCYEKEGDFCHRHILAQWLENTTGVEIEEWRSEDERRKEAVVDSLIEF